VYVEDQVNKFTHSNKINVVENGDDSLRIRRVVVEYLINSHERPKRDGTPVRRIGKEMTISHRKI
jgi:hypothetical protein